MAISVDVQKKLGEFELNVKFESASKRIGILGASGCDYASLIQNQQFFTKAIYFVAAM